MPASAMAEKKAARRRGAPASLALHQRASRRQQEIDSGQTAGCAGGGGMFSRHALAATIARGERWCWRMALSLLRRVGGGSRARSSAQHGGREGGGSVAGRAAYLAA